MLVLYEKEPQGCSDNHRKAVGNTRATVVNERVQGKWEGECGVGGKGMVGHWVATQIGHYRKQYGGPSK